MIVLILVMILFLGLTIVFAFGKGEMLIAGYNTASKEEQEQVNTVRMCKDFAKMTGAITLSLVLFLPGALWNEEIYFILGTAGIVLSVLIGLIYMNTGNRYARK